MIRNVSIWNTALPASDIQSLANGTATASNFPVPEPGAGAMVGIAALGLLRRRRSFSRRDYAMSPPMEGPA
jgi:hypothetical protein